MCLVEGLGVKERERVRETQMRESDFLPWGKLATIAQQCPVHTMSCVDSVVHRAVFTVAAVTVWAGTTWKLSVCLCVCVCVPSGRRDSRGSNPAEDGAAEEASPQQQHDG